MLPEKRPQVDRALVTSRPSDIDVVLANGYGFPRWEGGIVCWARHQHRDVLERDIEKLAIQGGPGFMRADLLPLLEPVIAL